MSNSYYSNSDSEHQTEREKMFQEIEVISELRAELRQEMGCPDDQTLSGFVDGVLKKKFLLAYLAAYYHINIKGCSACRQDIAELRLCLNIEDNDSAIVVVINRTLAFFNTFLPTKSQIAVALILMLCIGVILGRYYLIQQEQKLAQLDNRIERLEKVVLPESLPKTTVPKTSAPKGIFQLPIMAASTTKQIEHKRRVTKKRLETIYDAGNSFKVLNNNTLAAMKDSPTITSRSLKVRLPDQVTKLFGSRQNIMSEDSSWRDKIVQISPFSTMVLNGQPNLQWQAIAGATSYQVSIYSEDDNHELVESSGSLNVTEWQPTRILLPNKRYFWELEVTINSELFNFPLQNQPRARFQVLDQDQVEQLEGELKNIEATNPGSNLLIGMVYADFGLLDQATTIFQQLKQDNPNSKLVDRLLNSVKREARQVN